MKQKYIDIQVEEIAKHNITLLPRGESTCKQRTHVHIHSRILCKWNQKNSLRSTFTLLHEIGHVETFKSGMRRVESEYEATQWAATECRKLGLEVPEKTRQLYQDYIYMELERGIRHGGKNYASSYDIKW